MPFLLRLERAAPPLASEDLRSVALSFLRKVGVVTEGYDPLLPAEAGPKGGPPVRVLVDCFLLKPDRSWSAAEIARELRVPLGQVYRTVEKMRALDWIQDARDERPGALAGRHYRLRFGSLPESWKFTSLSAGLCLDRYGRAARALEQRVASMRRGAGEERRVPKSSGEAAGAAREAFVLRLSDDPLPLDVSARDLAAAFLHVTGVVPDRTGGRKIQSLPSFRLFYGAFLLGGARWWSLEELASEARSTRPTLVKHLRRLEGLDLLERATVEDEFGFPRRRWRLRQGSLDRAFAFTDARARLALDAMARWADHIEGLAQQQPRPKDARQGRSRGAA